jgi:peptidyl-prolyl cis-trans isomerase SurA
MRFRSWLVLVCAAAGVIALDHTLSHSQELIEAVVAVVDDDIILLSELEEQIYLLQVQSGRQITDEEELNELRDETLQRMIDERLLLAEAERETIVVSEDDIEKALDQAVDRLKSRFGSEAELQRQLELENTSIAQLRNLYRGDIVRQITVERLIDKEIRSGVQVSWGEVSEYFENNQDKIPDIGPRVELSHIFLAANRVEKDREAALSKINLALGELRAGKDFEDVAREYSDDPSADFGGALGYIGRGDMVPEFEEAAFALGEGQISDVVETRFGFHIIKANEVRNDGRINISHILALIEPSESGLELAKARADSVREMFMDGQDFAELAEKYSDDEATKSNSGYIGWIDLEAVPPELSDAVASLESNEISEPIEAPGGYHLVLITDRAEKHSPSFEEVREQLREALRTEKMAALYDELVQQLRSEIYVDVRLDKILEDES